MIGYDPAAHAAGYFLGFTFTQNMIGRMLSFFNFRMIRAPLLSLLLACPASASNAAAEPQGGVDREFTFETTMQGFTGIGGEIDGLRNPVLAARKGERVRINIVNGELMVHDVALERHGAASGQVLEKGATSFVEFVAEQDDTYYCTIPGHRASMSGPFRILGEKTVAGVLPEVNGRPLNLNFETGTLEDWTVWGDAFLDQPVKGDAIAARRKNSQSNHQGEYWIGSREKRGDYPVGTLTSAEFKITHPYASFLIGGGPDQGTRVELVLAENDEVFLIAVGLQQEEMRPVVVDLRPHQGKQMYIRLVDDERGSWGHLNFDEFLFYATRPIFVDERDAGARFETGLPPVDEIPYAGLSAQEAAAAMTVPDGFSVTVAAAEPDVVRPIAMAIDHRGRVWVAEGHTYPRRAPEGEGKDNILIFEDEDGDGKFDSRKVFIEGLNLVSGLEVGFGGVWVGAAPYLLYIPIAEDGDSPAGDPQVLLDGWGYQDTHETVNGFNWGPDGWLWGTHGVFTHSRVGKPGTPDEERIPINAGFWRFHPQDHRFEVVAHGTSNPWGIDFDDHGQAFATVCVIPHLFHVIPGARYHRQSGKHFNPHTYEDIDTMADHVHWAGHLGPHRGNRRSGSAGGGHAHVGAMIYLGGSWPDEYRNRIFMHNVHGFRSNTDILERRGSGYIAHHGPDFLLANDAWFQGLNFRYGPGGSVYMNDWYDKNQCHSLNPDVHDKTLGRIYHIRHENDQFETVDLREKSSAELVAYQLHENEWYVRHARRLLQERGPDAAVHQALGKILDENPDVTRKLRALWALHATNGLDEDRLVALSENPMEHVRHWAVRFIAEDKTVSESALDRFAAMAATDGSALVRLALASALQRIPHKDRWEILENLVIRAEDAGDANIPLMLWYAAEPLVEEEPARALKLAMSAELPHILPFAVRRVSALGGETARAVFTSVLAEQSGGDQALAIRDALGALNGDTKTDE